MSDDEKEFNEDVMVGDAYEAENEKLGMYEPYQSQLTEEQFNLWWHLCAEVCVYTSKEDMPDVEEANFNRIKELTDEECIAELQKEME